MNKDFTSVYADLNAAQRKAVDLIDGPMLVVAGPGTGKTQLLSARVANILKLTDTDPGSILCLTFTDNASLNMRERLRSMIGQPSYHVAIHTFHSFGSEVIGQYGDYFTRRPMIQAIDELGRYELMKDIFYNLPHDNPLSIKVGDDFIFLKDSLDIIGWAKQNALTPAELRTVIIKNGKFIDEIEDQISDIFKDQASPKHKDKYLDLLTRIQNLEDEGYYGFADYAYLCANELSNAIDQIPEVGRYAPSITTWRNNWCIKNGEGKHVLKDSGRNQRKMLAVATVYQLFIDKMASKGLYDFDDMIVEVVHALENENELRFNLQEKYQYILVDEFQDTNKAQLRILQSLGNNPVSEGRPNIMAVGDDDQAIYAFQGAETSNMLSFVKSYVQPAIIPLQENYRSTSAILEASYAIATQIGDRLQSVLPEASKNLVAKTDYSKKQLDYQVHSSELAQYDAVANQIKKYIDSGTAPEQIAVIAPRHRYLESLMPYLIRLNLPVAYERRENILDAPIIVQLLTMARLIIAISKNQQHEVDSLIYKVISFDFWEIPAEEILKISLDSYSNYEHWLPLMLGSGNDLISGTAKWFIELAGESLLEPLEYILDKLMGDSEYDRENALKGNNKFSSPLRSYNFNKNKFDNSTSEYLALLGQLSSLRQHLRQWKPDQAIYLEDFIIFSDLHLSAKIKIIDTNPHTQSVSAVQVMTAYKAKGLEFDVVFVINAQDAVWGPTSRSRSPSISLPKNLPLAPAREGDNDKLRLFFVALTRAKNILHITGYQLNVASKIAPPLSFIINKKSEPLSPHFSSVNVDDPTSTRAIEILTNDWSDKFKQVIASKQSLLEPILDRYQLSVTHLNNFLDVTKGGPNYFLLHNLLRFPEAPTPAASYGDAIHKTMQWIQLELKQAGSLPNNDRLKAYFTDVMERKQLRQNDKTRLINRGQEALTIYMGARKGRFLVEDIYERNFKNEGVIVNEARLSGKIDKIHFDGHEKIDVIDFKTGKPAISWTSKDDYEKVKLYKYSQQLMFYKFLIEKSSSFKNKLVVSAGLEFIETNEQGDIVNDLALAFDKEELARFELLVGSVWQHIMNQDFPDTSDYAQNVNGIKKFESDLIEGTI